MRLVYFGLTLLVACAGRDGIPARVAVAPEAAVYAALLESVAPWLPDTLVVGDSTLQFRIPRGAVHEWQTQFDSMPTALPVALERLSRTKQPTAKLPLSRPLNIVTDSILREIFAGDTGGGWTEFYRRYPRQREYMRFSPVALSADTVDALVYYEYS
ncbi:MAG: hypothetical protein ABI328_02700 [Gemmatimonadaceae bacterium]